MCSPTPAVSSTSRLYQEIAVDELNGIDAIRLGTQESMTQSGRAMGGRVVAISLSTNEEHWRHERPKVASIGGPPPKPGYKNVGDPVASGIAVANDIVYFTTLMSSKLMALDADQRE